MTKNELHQLIEENVKYIENKQVTSNPTLARVYGAAITLLKGLDDTIFKNIPAKKREQMSASFAMFGVKELESYDLEDISKKLAYVGSEYDQTLGLTDPYLDKLIRGDRDRE